MKLAVLRITEIAALKNRLAHPIKEQRLRVCEA